MAYSFVVEDGTGKTTSTSYSSVADADQYIDDIGGNSTWASASTSDKELALIQGSQYLDLKYTRNWLGARVSGTQALAWPRESVNIDGHLRNSNEIPANLKYATSELAVIWLVGSKADLFVDETAPAGPIKSENVSIGSISVNTTYASASSTQKVYTKVNALVSTLTAGAGRIVRS
jgi:hypothetical protein